MRHSWHGRNRGVPEQSAVSASRTLRPDPRHNGLGLNGHPSRYALKELTCGCARVFRGLYRCHHSRDHLELGLRSNLRSVLRSGGGASGSTGSCETFPRSGTVFATGTDNLGYLLIQLVLNPSAVLNFCGVRFGPGGREGEIFTASSDTVATVALRALVVAIVYLAVLLVVSWYAFRRSQIVESA